MQGEAVLVLIFSAIVSAVDIDNRGEIGILHTRNKRHIDNHHGGEIGIVHEHNARNIDNHNGGEIGIVHEHNVRNIDNHNGGEIGIVHEHNARDIQNHGGGTIGDVKIHGKPGPEGNIRNGPGGDIGAIVGSGDSVKQEGGHIGTNAVSTPEGTQK